MPKKCLLCSKHAADPFVPFCSERCKMRDLGHWFQETYAIPVAETSVEAVQDDDGTEKRKRM